MKYSQFLWGILSLIILSNGSIAQQAAAEDEEEYSEDEYEEYEEYDYGGCSKFFVGKKSLETLKNYTCAVLPKDSNISNSGSSLSQNIFKTLKYKKIEKYKNTFMKLKS